MNKKKLHMIGNAHIDPVWLWQWQEGYHEVKATFRSALDRMKEYDDFIFVASSAAFYEWIEESDPAMFAEIQQRVKEGRWSIVGGWWIEPDCNIPSGESFARHGLYGQRYFKEKFGVTVTTGFNIDSFGHAATLPQILSKSGIKHYTFLRPGPHEMNLPGRLFWWQAADGSRVMALEIPFSYGTWGNIFEEHAQRCAAEMKDPIDEWVCYYGVGNHGGGPTIENIENLHRMAADPNLFFTPICSSPDKFFQVVREKGWNLPVVPTELQHHASGCYAAHSGIKRWNRQAENRLMMAEKWSSVAAWQGVLPYPQDFTHAWKQVLFNQFHDIMAGSSLPGAYDDARESIGEAMSIAGRNLNKAIQTLAWNINIPLQPEARPLVVFNPNTWSVKTHVDIESNSFEAGDVMVDEQDQPVPFQSTNSTTRIGRVRLSITPEVPALGYRTFRVFPKKALPAGFESPDFPIVQASETVLENARFRLEINPQSGAIASLRDKVAGVEVFNAEAAVPVVIEDDSDTWSHDVFKFDKVVGKFTATRLRLLEKGPVKSVIQVISQFGKSQIIQNFTMYAGLEKIDVAVTVDWREEHKMLKLRFPVNVQDVKLTNEIAYGTVERQPNGLEESYQGWVDVTGKTSDNRTVGLSILNDSKYSLDVNGSDIGLTVLRSPVYAHHNPYKLTPGDVNLYMDQGIQQFTYSLLPHIGDLNITETSKRAAELVQLPIMFYTTFHPQGKLPQTDSYIAVIPGSVIVTVLKKAEDSDDLVLRAYNPEKSPAHATINLPKWNRTIETDFGACEIKTLCVPRDPIKPVRETNLVEWDI